ncbi:hypothetical protein, partial [Klebsiella pneumoniae]|uniref:hypothetical protein n=1 Tax=Klebsiella pneumoniae TaxID=573 RepID=UPI001D0EF1D5
MRLAAQYDQPGASGLAWSAGWFSCYGPVISSVFWRFLRARLQKVFAFFWARKLILESLCDFYTPDIRAATIKLNWLYIIDNN